VALPVVSRHMVPSTLMVPSVPIVQLWAAEALQV
jgi:hypothetical protein